MSRFLAVGDLHIGAGADYGRETGDRLRDQETVWARALELAAEHDVDAVLFAGDAFHRRRPTPAELVAFQRPLQAFNAEHDIEILGIPGNHDIESAMLPNALEIFGREIDLHVEPGLWHAPGGTVVATLPWTPVSRLVAARGGGDRDELNQVAAEILINRAAELRGQGADVLMLHWSISGAATPTGAVTDEFREVVLPLAELEQLGYQAIVAGHIHKAQRLDDIAKPGLQAPIFYTGSPAPVDFGEASTPHGVALLNIDGPRTLCTFLPIESRPFVTLDLLGDDPGLAEPSSIQWPREVVEDAVIRVRYTATEEQARRIDHSAIKAALHDAGAHKVYAIQPTILRENRARVEDISEDITPLAAVDAWVTANEISTEHSAALADLTTRYLEGAVS